MTDLDQLEATAAGCHYCGSTRLELRPYGPGGALVCHPCATATPERAVSPVGVAVIGQESGPVPFDPAAVKGGDQMGGSGQHPDCGHLCCDTRPDPFHDHFLDATECPRCESAKKAQKLLAAIEPENVIGYVVVAREGRHGGLFPDAEGWTFVDGRYGRLVDAQADARHLKGKVADMQFRVAKLVLLPEEGE